MKKTLLIVPALVLAAMGTMRAQAVIYSEDFEGTTGTAIPGTWLQTMATGSDGWKSGTNTDLQSSYFPMPAHTRFLATNDDACNCNKSNDFLKTSTIDLSTASAPVLTFDAIFVAAQDASGHQEVATVEASTDGGSTWTVLKSLGSITSWTSQAVSLSAYATNSNVMIGFRYNDDGMWGYGMTLDNVQVIEPPTREASVTGIIMKKYILAGSTTLKAVLKSLGGPEVTTAELNYSVDGVMASPQTFSPSINYGDSYTASFTAPATLSAGLHVIKAWVNTVNDDVDGTPENDTAMFQVTAQSTIPVKNVFVEEYTGAWCGYCPRGGVALGQITSDTSVVGVAEHNSDHMSTAEGDVVTGDYISGFPSGMVDRAFVPSQGDYAIDNSVWDAAVAARKAEVVPATVSLSGISYNTTTREIKATVNVRFFGDVKGAYSVNCIVSENNVSGSWGNITDNQWNQHSYYYNDATSDWYQIGLTSGDWTTSVAGLIPNMYTHNHVVDKMMGGAYGDASVIPTILVPAGNVYSKEFSYFLPASNPGGASRFNPNNIHIVGLVSEYDPGNKENRYVLNVTERKLNSNSESTSVQDIEKTSFGAVAVFPNPASTTATVALELNANENVSITVYNALGQAVSTEEHASMSAGSHLINLNVENLANGIYNVVVSTKNSSITKKVSINK